MHDGSNRSMEARIPLQRENNSQIRFWEMLISLRDKACLPSFYIIQQTSDGIRLQLQDKYRSINKTACMFDNSLIMHTWDARLVL